MSCVVIINSDMDNGASAMTAFICYMKLIHELVITYSYRFSIYLGHNTMTTDFLNICNSISVYLSLMGTLQTQAYRMRGSTFCQGCIFQQLFLGQSVVMYGANLKNSMSQGASFVKNHIFYLGQGFKIIGAFNQNSLLAGTTNASEKAQRHTYNQGARTADYQES